MKKVLTLLLLVGAVFAGWWYLKGRDAEHAAQLPERELTARAERRDLEASIKLNGDVTPAIEVEIKPEIGGRVKALHIEAGQTVKRGDVLLEIDDTDLLTDKASAETDIAGSRLEVERARRNFQRVEDLFRSKLISREVYDNTKSELEIAENNLLKSQSRLRTVEDRLGKTQVLAPTDGTVLVLNIIEGQVVVAAASVNSGTVLMTIADLSRLIINTHVNQVDIAHVKPDTVVEFVSDAIGNEPMKATIHFIAPIATVKNNIKGFAVEAVIENPDPRLRPGMTVTMHLATAQAPDAVSVPISAIFKEPDSDGDVVYVRKGNATEKRTVTVGLTTIHYAEVLSGLQPEEEVWLVVPPEQQS